VEVVEDLTDYTDVVLPGLPPPLSGARFDALKRQIREFGLLDPIVADDENRVYVGRSRARACRELGIPAQVSRVPAEEGVSLAWASMVNRQWTAIEKAELIVQVEATHFSSVRRGSGDKRELVAGWIKARLGWTGMGGRTLDSYKRLARLYSNLDGPIKDRVREAESLGSALELAMHPIRVAKLVWDLTEELQVSCPKAFEMVKGVIEDSAGEADRMIKAEKAASKREKARDSTAEADESDSEI
jgi:hypothetical protein